MLDPVKFIRKKYGKIVSIALQKDIMGVGARLFYSEQEPVKNRPVLQHWNHLTFDPFREISRHQLTCRTSKYNKSLIVRDISIQN